MTRTTSTFARFLLVAVVLAGCSASVASPSAPPPVEAKVTVPASPDGGSPQPMRPPVLPPALRGRWVSETRSIPGLNPPAVESFMQLSGDQMLIHASEDWTAPILTSLAWSDGTTGVRLRLGSDSVGCTAGTEGDYTFSAITQRAGRSTSSSASIHAPRASPRWSATWTRIGCPDNHNCLGELDAGPARLGHRTRRSSRSPDWHYDYGRFGYTVPEGWSNPEDNQDGYVLVPQAGPDGAGIYVFSDVLAHAQAHDPDRPATAGARPKPASAHRPLRRSATGSGRWPGSSISHEDRRHDRGPDGVLDGPRRRAGLEAGPAGGPARRRACRCS